MNKWFRRAVGTVGIAGGVLLLGAGTAHADDSVPAAKDPQQLQGLFDELLKPTGGLSGQALSMAAPTRAPGHASVPGVFGALPIDDASRTAGLGELATAAPDAPRMPVLETLLGVLGMPGAPDLAAHPTNAVPVVGERVTHAVPAAARPAALGQLSDSDDPGIDAPNTIGDDLVNQSGVAESQPTNRTAGGGLPGLGGLSGMAGGLAGVTGGLPGVDGGLPGMGRGLPTVASDLPGLDGTGLPHPDSDLPALDGRGLPRPTGIPGLGGGLPSAPALGGGLPSLPSLGSVPSPQSVPGLQSLPGTAAGGLGAVTRTVGPAARATGRPVPRSAERPIARGIESGTGSAAGPLDEGLPAPLSTLPVSALPAGNLPIFESLSAAPAALGQVTGVGRHRAPGPDLVSGAAARTLPAVDQAGLRREKLGVSPSVDPAAVGQLPIFGAVVRDLFV